MTMTILVAGATGKTGLLLVQELLDPGHKPTALVRESSISGAQPQGVELRKGYLTDLQADACECMDAVIFAGGPGEFSGADMTDKVDRDRARRVIDVARDARVKRFVMLNSVGADQTVPTGELAHYLKAEHAADVHLMASGLTCAILRSAVLTNEKRRAHLILGKNVNKSAEASRASVAHVLAEAATTGRYDGTALDMQSA